MVSPYCAPQERGPWLRKEATYSCVDLEMQEGFPGHSPGCCAATRARLSLGPNQKFLVCSRVGGWLLDRGVAPAEVKDVGNSGE